MAPFSHGNNCPIRERTADGRSVGRCWTYMVDGKTCERHGDVEIEAKYYRETGKLTDENDLEARRK